MREWSGDGEVMEIPMPHNLNSLEIRVAKQGDIQSLMKLYDQLNPDDPKLSADNAERVWLRFQSYSGSGIFIGLEDGILVTTCTLVVVPNLTRGGLPYGLIENVITAADHRKKGYGKAVIKEAVSAAWHYDCYKIMLLTGSKDPATLKFYQGIGFEQNKTGFQIRRLPVRRA